MVDDDGLVVPVSKCTVKELRAEATARGTTDAAGMKRPELTALIKVGFRWLVVLHLLRGAACCEHAAVIVSCYVTWELAAGATNLSCACPVTEVNESFQIGCITTADMLQL